MIAGALTRLLKSIVYMHECGLACPSVAFRAHFHDRSVVWLDSSRAVANGLELTRLASRTASASIGAGAQHDCRSYADSIRHQHIQT
jgi:hypothetical protein